MSRVEDLINQIPDPNVQQELLKEIQGLKRNKKFGLVWENTSEDMLEQLKTSVPVLQRDTALDVTKNGEDVSFQPPHILVEGDNLDALVALQATHTEKVDVIYIDPPYNTGNKDFIYNDQYVDKEDYHSHSKWLSFMERRLSLAKNLLKDTGVIFISIDDNEQAHLRLLCDQTFGGSNFIGQAVRKTRSYATTKGDAELQTLGEYLLVYAKGKTSTKLKKKIIGQKEYPREDSRGRYYIVPLNDNGPHGYATMRPNLYYPIYSQPDGSVSLEATPGSKENLPPLKSRKKGCWMWGKEKFGREKQDLIEIKGKIYIKHYYNPEEDQNKKQHEKLWLEQFPTTHGTKELSAIFGLGDKVFNYPKPTEFIMWCLNLHPSQDAVVLDFFAGSGTTGHAVAQLNAEDGGTRQAILVTNNENNICRNVTQPRMQAVLTGVWADGKPHEPLPGELCGYTIAHVPTTRNTDAMRGRFTPRSEGFIQLENNTYLPASDDKTENMSAEEDNTFPNFPYEIYTNHAKNKLVLVWTDMYDTDDLQTVLDHYTVSPDWVEAEKVVYVASNTSSGEDYLVEDVADDNPAWQVAAYPERFLAPIMRTVRTLTT